MRSVASLTLAFACLVAALAALPPPAAAGPARIDGRERAMLRGINRARARHGVPALRRSPRLARAADYHSWEMLDAGYFAHESRDGGSFDRRIRRFAHHRAVGETLAMVGRCGRRSPRRIVRMWMNSPPHRAVLLSATYRRIGIARRTGSLGGSRACVVTADFGSRR